ncbi:MAG TPA: efflux transporter outer membrane subunit [Acidobacteriota bacterium]
MALLVCVVVAATDCSVGPKYRKPSVQVPVTYKEQPPAGWKTAQPQDAALRGKWWEIFGDQQLNALEEQVNVSNQNVAVAEAQFRGARAAIRVARAGLFPTITGGASVNRSHPSSNRAVRQGVVLATTTDYNLPIDLSYEADVWGRIRHTIEANLDNAQATAADLEAVRLSMHSELALDFFHLQGLDAEKQLLDSTVAAYQKALDLTTNRYNQGIVARVDVTQAETQLATTRAQATDLAVQRAQFEHAIAILIGKPPSELTIAPGSMAAKAPAIPVSLPSEILERRPDIAAAERHMASANEQIGVAKTAFYPTVALTGAAGLESSRLSNWLSWPSRFWSLGSSLVETAFDGGRRRAITREAQAAYDTTLAIYRQDVLTAFQEIEDNLAALRILDEEAKQHDEAVAAAEHSLSLATNRYRGGITTYLEVITAQSVALANQRTAVDLLTRRMAASVLLIKALGGGWSTSELPSPKDLTTTK